MNEAQSDENALHQPAAVRPLSRCTTCTEHTAGGALYTRCAFGLLVDSKSPTQKSFLVTSRINHPLLVIVIQPLPQANNCAGLLIAEEERGLPTKLHQVLSQFVHVLVPGFVLVVDSLYK